MNPSPPDFNGLNLRPSLLTTALRALWRSPRTWGVLAGALPGLAAAGPSGEQVVAGDVAVNRPDARHTVIDQASSKAILNWQQFSIAGDEFVQFNQPGRGAVALNRVVGGDVSNILGSLTANGQVFLVNPRGIYFGPNATVDVGGLVAGIMDIRDEDFLAGRYTFSRHDDSPAGAAVVNDGYIRAREGGYVVLAGDYTANAGVVEARLGRVVLASGSRMTLDMEGDGLVSFAVDEAVLGELAGVENSGELLADGGRVVMTAKVADELLGAAVNNTGLVRAHSVAEHGGEIYLTAAGGDMVNGGTLDADAGDGEAGGTVRVLGDRDIDLPAGGTITARGDGDGRGGDVRVVANDHLAFRLDHTIDVGGGAPNRGGFVEVSGHGGLQLAGTLHLGGGRVVIDPDRINVNFGFGGPGGGTNSAGTTSLGAGFLGNLLAGNSDSDGADVYLVADDAININASINGQNGYGNQGGDLQLILGTVTGGSGPDSSYGVFTGVGSIDVRAAAGGTIGLNNDITLDGDLVINAGQDGGGAGVGSINIGTSFFSASVANFTAYGAIDGAEGIDIQAAGDVFMEDASVDGVFGEITVSGNGVATGNLSAVGSLSASVDISGTAVSVGDVDVSANSSNANVNINGGNVNAGNVTATGGSGSYGGMADVNISGDNVTAGNVAATAGSGSYGGGMADIRITGNGVTTGTLTAEGFGGSPSPGARIRVTGNGSDVSIGGLEATAHNGHDAFIGVDAYGGGGHDLVVDGAATATGANADVFINNFTDGDLTVNGTVTATGTSGDASIGLFSSGSGAVTAGNLAASGASAAINVRGQQAVSVGDASAAASNGAADLFVRSTTDNGGAVETGNLTASAPAAETDATIIVTGYGAVTAGNVTVTAGSDGSATVQTFGNAGVSVGELEVSGGGSAFADALGNGAVTVGRVALAGATAEAILSVQGGGSGDVVVGNVAVDGGSSAAVDISHQGTGPLAVGDVAATASYGDVDIDIWTSSTGAVTVGNVTASGTSASVNVWGSVGAVSAGDVMATGTSGRAEINVWVGGSDAVMVGNVSASGSIGSVNVWNSGSGAVTVSDVTATGTAGHANIDVWSSAAGAVTVGNLTATGTSANADVWGSGTVTVGNVSLTGTDGDGHLDIWSNGAGAAVTVGDITVAGAGSYGDGSAHIWGSGGGAITVGNVMAAGNSASVSFSRFGSGTGAISVGDVTAEAGGSGDARIRVDGAEGGSSPGDVAVGRLAATAGSASGDTASIFVRGRDITTQDLVMDGAARRLQVFGRDIKVASAGGIDLGSSGTIEASRSLTMVARQGDITNAYGNMIQADAIALAAPNGSILLPNTRIYVGDGIARDLGGNPLLADAELINTLQQNAGQIFEGAEPASESINAFFQAGEELVLGSVPQGDAGDYQLDGGSVTDGLNVADGYLALQLGIGTDIDGDSIPDDDNKTGYAWFEGQVVDLGPVVGEAANIIVQWASPNDLAISGDAAPDAIIQLEQSTTYLTVPDHFSRFAGTTHAPGFAAHPLSTASPAVPGTPGGPYVGNVDITGTVGLGSANFLLLTGGSATGLENIQTTGLVALINVLAGPPEEPPGADDTGELLEAVDSEEGELEDLVEEDVDDPESPDTSPRGDQALARVCQ